MKNVTALAALAILLALSSNTYARGSSFGGHSSSHSSYSSYSRSDHTISGYTRGGTYVSPSHAKNPDATRNNNYSTKGNVNPYTGKPGTKSRDSK
jgi:hypothetical protein